ncbi:hypothetical protein H4R33_004891 [Dimargaris cristalligena]|nr:hypothetical protein H4R33_004891 [Dimargaris cristalligena]
MLDHPGSHSPSQPSTQSNERMLTNPEIPRPAESNSTGSGQPALAPATAPVKPKRRKVSDEQLVLLVEVFDQTDTPNHEIRENLSKKLGMTNRDVQVWFQNRRAKVNREKASAQAARYSGDHHHHHHLMRAGRCRSISDASSNMSYQFVPIVSCDKSKTGAAMSQSLRGQRYHHPPPIAPSPHSSYPPGSPGMGMNYRPTASASGPLRPRRGSHTVDCGPVMRASPYSMVSSPKTSSLAPAMAAVSLNSNPNSTYPYQPTHPHSHRPEPLQIGPHANRPWGSPTSAASHYPTPGSSSPLSPGYPPLPYSPVTAGAAYSASPPCTVPFPHPTSPYTASSSEQGRYFAPHHQYSGPSANFSRTRRSSLSHSYSCGSQYINSTEGYWARPDAAIPSPSFRGEPMGPGSGPHYHLLDEMPASYAQSQANPTPMSSAASSATSPYSKMMDARARLPPREDSKYPVDCKGSPPLSTSSAASPEVVAPDTNGQDPFDLLATAASLVHQNNGASVPPSFQKSMSPQLSLPRPVGGGLPSPSQLASAVATKTPPFSSGRAVLPPLAEDFDWHRGEESRLPVRPSHLTRLRGGESAPRRNTLSGPHDHLPPIRQILGIRESEHRC